MAAAAVTLARGMAPDAVREGLASFAGVAHRLEEIATLDGVLYVNDSKATNVASAVAGLESFAGGVHVILGGRGKGGDYAPLAAPVAERARAAYLIGETAPRARRRRWRTTGVPLHATRRPRARAGRRARARRGRARSCCSRRRAPPSTSTPTTRRAASTSGRSWRVRASRASNPRLMHGRQQQQPLEHRLLLTATLCLLAGGAVMVYSASQRAHAAAGRRRRHRLPGQVPRLRRRRARADAGDRAPGARLGARATRRTCC